MALEFTSFARKPFLIEAIEVTNENLEEVAKLLGSLRRHKDGTRYIRVGDIIPNLDRVYVGFFLTKMGDTIRCYSEGIFHSMFVENTPEIQEWIDYMNRESQHASTG